MGTPWSSLTSSSSPLLQLPEIDLPALASMPLIVPSAIEVVVCAPTLWFEVLPLSTVKSKPVLPSV